MSHELCFLTANQVFITQPCDSTFSELSQKTVLTLNGAPKVWMCREGGDVVAAELQETGYSQCPVGFSSGTFK